MSHDPHEAWPTFDDRQILKDGCMECESRSDDNYLGIGHMDPETFGAAWKRAADWQRDEDIGHIAEAERNLLETLWAVQVQLEQRGIPLGIVPGAKHLRASA